jgi:hypothetical protein
VKDFALNLKGVIKMMKTRNTVLKLIALIALVTTGTAWGTTSASAADNNTRSTGLFGITQHQTARLNVVNLEDVSQDDPFFRVEMTFLDGEGNILSQKVYEIKSGKSAFLDLKGIDVVGRDTNRTHIRAVVRFVDTPDTLLYMWMPTLEVFDNDTGETRFLLPAVQKVQKV